MSASSVIGTGRFIVSLIGQTESLLNEIDKLNSSLSSMGVTDMRKTYVLDEVTKLEERVVNLIKANESSIMLAIDGKMSGYSFCGDKEKYLHILGR